MAADHLGPRSLGKLLEAVISLGSELDLDTVLRRIVEAGVELTGASYGALGVLDEQRAALSQFITVGIDEEARGRIGALPKGLGLLGALIRDARPLRVADLSEYEGRSGFPPHHPAMTSFLGVPIRIRDEVFGNLYLTEKRDGEVFTDVDETLVLGLASAAGVAIRNARLFDELKHREEVLSAIQAVATSVLRGDEPDETLHFVAERARVLADADLSTFALPSPDGTSLVMDVTDGDLGSGLKGVRFPRAGSVSGAVLGTSETIVIADLSKDHRTSQPQVRMGTVGPAIFVTLTAGGRPLGTLFVGRAVGRREFSGPDVDLVRSFAAQASVVLDSAEHRTRLSRMSLLEEKERIARDLHDTVVQQVYALGLSLGATMGMIADELPRQRVSTAIDDLDDVIRQIRTVIFEVGTPVGSSASGFRRDLLELTHESSRVLGFEPVLSFEGPIDTFVDGELAQTALATVREALSNVARHARATRVELSVAVDDRRLRISVTDDGVGFPADPHDDGGRGIHNMRKRAEEAGGDLDIGPASPHGTKLLWTASLD